MPPEIFFTPLSNLNLFWRLHRELENWDIWNILSYFYVDNSKKEKKWHTVLILSGQAKHDILTSLKLTDELINCQMGVIVLKMVLKNILNWSECFLMTGISRTLASNYNELFLRK